MKPYGIKHKKLGICECEYCGRNKKKAIKRRERQLSKDEIAKALAQKRPGKKVSDEL